MAYKKFLFLGTTGVITEQDVTADGIEVNSLKVNSLSTGVAHVDSSGVVSSSSIVTADIAAKAITNAKIDDGAVDTLQLAASAVTAAKLADDAVETDKIKDLAVTFGKLAGSIPDSKLDQISTAGKVANSATSATSANTSSAIVARDASGDFSAGMITADLTGDVTGNASTASKWFSSISVGFAGGDVTGSFSGLDGSGDISNVNLTIGALKVTNSMLAGSIEDSKLNQITSSNKVADSALSSNVALLNANSQSFTGTAPAFSNALSVGAPTLAAHATTKTYVDDAVAAATSGLDYKQEAKWYFDLANAGGSKAALIAGIDAMGGSVPFVAGDRALLNDSAGANVDVGIYVFGGSAGAWTLTRSSDFAAGSSAAGAWIYCLDALGPSGTVSLDTAYVCPTEANVGQAIQFVVYAAGKTYTGTAPIVVTGTAISLDSGNGLEVSANKLTVKASAVSAISVGSGGVAVEVDDSTIQIVSNELAFKSLPSQFKVNGTATSANVTAANLSTLADGAAQDATSLHHHEAQLMSLDRDSGQAAFDAGTAVISNSSGKLIRADKSAGKCIGLSYLDDSGAVLVASSGEIVAASGIWTSSAPSNGEAVYLGASGKLAKYADLGSGDYVTKVGRLVAGNKIAVAIQDVGLRA